MFEFHNVTKTFKKDFWQQPFKALDSLSFRISPHSLTGFLGANGSGKTTAIKVLLEIIFPSSGNVTFPYWQHLSKKERLKKIGYVPERPYYYSYLSGLEFLTYMGQLNGVSSKNLKKRIETYTEKLSIAKHLNKKIESHSKGMLQRLGLTASLLHDPELLILDEPTSGIDPLGRKEIKDFLIDLRDEGKTIFISSHIVSDLEEICSNLIIIESGKLAYQGLCHDLIRENSEENYYALLEIQDKYLSSVANKVKKIAGKYEYSFDGKKREHFFKRCLSLGLTPIRFERKSPSLEDIVYHIS